MEWPEYESYEECFENVMDNQSFCIIMMLCAVALMIKVGIIYAVYRFVKRGYNQEKQIDQTIELSFSHLGQAITEDGLERK